MASHMEKVRAFIAINLPPGIIAELEKLQKTLRAQCPSGSVRWSGPHQMHLTLRFLGEIEVRSVAEVETAMRHACQGIAPFSLTAQHLGCFPNRRHPSVIWAGISGDTERLQDLQTRLEQATASIGKPVEKRPFHPHLTLGRVKTTHHGEAREIGRIVEATAVAALGQWTVREVHLMRSELFPKGAIYTSLSSIQLTPVASYP